MFKKDNVSGLAESDWKGYIASMYKQYGKIISPMGCRAFYPMVRKGWYVSKR